MNINYVYDDNTNETVPQKLIKQYNLTLEFIFGRQLEDDYMEFLVEVKNKPEFTDHQEAINFDLKRFSATDYEIQHEQIISFPEAPVLSVI
ncbi:hypothetical protein [Bacillus weihaiensis]|uniref:hypothetical protein n=1 Tax=Bacillus weihaiensis TaxID=1547283 RepID=UPI0023525611|nr:hypothetical protein [Bacillus weihaiensis]